MALCPALTYNTYIFTSATVQFIMHIKIYLSIKGVNSLTSFNDFGLRQWQARQLAAAEGSNVTICTKLHFRNCATALKQKTWKNR